MDIARPEDLVTLQWVIITFLVGVIGYLWRELRHSDKKSRERDHELLVKVLAGLSESSLAMQNMADALEAYQDQLGISTKLELLRSEIKHDAKQD
jgi:hypothetical protein